MKVTDFDKNLEAVSIEGKDDIVFLPLTTEGFALHGVFLENGRLVRLPKKTAKNISDAVEFFHANTAGGRLRFKTDSPYVAIKCKFPNYSIPQMTDFGSTGFDVRSTDVDGEFHGVLRLPYGERHGGYESLCELGVKKMRNVTISFPLYNNVDELLIGLSRDAEILPENEYTYKTPVVFYGSSITQGCSASTPSHSYEGQLSERLDMDFVNLGFSGSAKGEKAMAEYIATLDMSVFVLDYDHNAPLPEHLQETHKPFFDIIRKAKPDLPIIMMTKPDFNPYNERDYRRREIVKATYDQALKDGDKNVYFLDGERFYDGYRREVCSVDGCHPTDLGMYLMANALEPLLKKLLKK